MLITDIDPKENHITLRRTIERELELIVPKLWPDETHEILKLLILKVEESGKITLPQAKKCWKNSPLTEKLKNTPSRGNVIVENYIQATIYNSKVRISQETSLSYSLLCRAAFHLGTLTWQVSILESQEKMDKRSKKAAEARSKKIDSVHDEIQRLLATLPDNSWTSREEAASIIIEKVDEFIIKNNAGKIINSTHDFIVRSLASRAGTQKNQKTSQKK